MRQTLTLAAVVGIATTLPAQQVNPQFGQELTGDRAILHALDRLTFGPRPGDIEAVKKMGLKQWIDLQLHPERIPANEALETLANSFVEPLGQTGVFVVLSNAVAQLQAGIQTAGPVRALQPQEVIPMEQVTMLRQGTAQQNLDFLATLPQEKEVQVLAVMPAIRERVAGMLDPSLRAKVEAAAQAQQGTFVANSGVVTVVNRLTPAGITQEQATMLRTGTDKEALDFLAMLGPEKTVQVLAVMPAVKDRLLPLLDADLRKKVMVASPSPAQPGQTLAQAKVYRAIESDRQLEEVLADFWYNHFNVDAGKGNARRLITTYDREVIRPHVMGKFRDLLEATANSPAMMLYLDNSESKAGGLNENYARELMELHTLGVNGGYSQLDIIEVARCFTGWTTVNTDVGNARFVVAGGTPAGFRYEDSLHDKGAKTVLGVTIPAGGGKEDGEKVLDILAKHPSTARFISRELAQRFVADDPPAALIESMAKTFRDTDGDIRAVLSTLFDSPEFFSEGAYRAKLKTPFEMIVSAVRATGAKVDDAAPLVSQISSLGQPLYRKLEPTGYSNVGSAWLSSAALMGRMNFALDLAQNKMDGVQVDSAKFSAVPTETARQVLFADPEPKTLEAIVTALAAAGDEQDSKSSSALAAGMLLGSPDFQRR
jgi:uncharacterized protein (DUF1800 family)